MSTLLFNGRPWTVFDAHNRLHRQWYFEFVKSKTWGRIPCRFIVPNDQGDLITMIERKLVAYYNNKEFGLAKKSRA